MPAANTKAMMPAAVLNPALEIPIGDTNLKTFCTATANGLLVGEVNVVNKDPLNARIIELYLNNGTTDYLVGSASIPANSGVSGNPSVKMLNVLSVAPFALQANYVLKVRSVVSLTSVIQIVGQPVYDYVAL